MHRHGSSWVLKRAALLSGSLHNSYVSLHPSIPPHLRQLVSDGRQLARPLPQRQQLAPQPIQLLHGATCMGPQLELQFKSSKPEGGTDRGRAAS